MRLRARSFHEEMHTRRTVRDFSSRPIPHDVIDSCLQAAATAPSGANRQPWHFVVITNPNVKRQIRRAAEKEEEAFYSGRAPDEWLEALAPLGTNAQKPFLEEAPILIAIFAELFTQSPEGLKIRNYYVSESVGIATGLLITALHHVGIATLTHTPSPMGFLNEILGRPRNEKPYILLVVGYPKEGAKVPHITRKTFEQMVTYIDPPKGQEDI